MATYTTNLNLKKPDYEDLADIADINANMDKVDELAERISTKLTKFVGTTAGTATALTVTITGATLDDFTNIQVRLHTDIGAGATLNLNGLGAKPIYTSGNVAVGAGSLTGSMLNLIYNATLSRWCLLDILSISKYTANMVKFFAIPGTTGKVRLKVEKPADSIGVMIRYKTTAWSSGDTKDTGTLLATITDDSNYKDANEWYEVSGLTDGTAYYFKAFPFSSGSYNETIGVNETVCKAGGLVLEYTMDSVSGSTLYDTGGSQNGTLSNITFESQKIGNGAVLASTPSLTGTFANAFGTIKEVNFWGAFNNSAFGYLFALYTYSNFSLQNVTIGDSTVTDLVISFNASDGGYLAGKKITISKDTVMRNYSLVWGNNALNDANFKAFINNVAQTLDSITTSGSAETPTNNNFTIFKRNTLAQDYLTNSKTDQIRFFSRELESYERANLYNGGAGC